MSESRRRYQFFDVSKLLEGQDKVQIGNFVITKVPETQTPAEAHAVQILARLSEKSSGPQQKASHQLTHRRPITSSKR